MKQFAFAGLAVWMLLAHSTTAVAQEVSGDKTSGAPARAEESAGFTTDTVSSWLNEAYQTTEAFRIKQARYFIGVRDELKKKLKIDRPAEDTTIDIGIGPTQEKTPSDTPATLDNPLDYAKYIGSISLATLFSNALIFYSTGALVLLLIVRFIVSRLV